MDPFELTDVTITPAKKKQYTETHSEELERKATELGADLVLPGPRDVFIDLDSPQDQYVMEALLPILAENGFPVDVIKITRSLNGNKHAYLRANRRLTEMERVLLQACLGSDRKRELLAFLHLNGCTQGHSTAFFEKRPF